ncbi:MAG: hypothetical protein GEU97_16670 [Actinophytocola sp.]|nr:hypothetical protein [Actinophytocola sp.]
MDTFANLLGGFATAITPTHLAFAALGVLLGTAIGVLPGIGPAMAVALLLPVTYSVEPTGAFIMFAGIYYGGMFGGSTTSILLNTPGESASVVTAIEGHPMAKRGRGSQALAAAAIGNFIGAMSGTMLLVLLAPLVADLAVTIGAPDFLAIMLAAFQQYGIQPGPLLFQAESELVWTLIASLFIGTVMLLLNLPLAPMWAKLLRIPRPYLYAVILFFASIGAYAVSGSVADLIVLLVIGVIGFLMRRFGLPALPVVIGVILGPSAELQMRRALQITDGDLGGLVNTGFSVTVYAIIAVILAWPLLRRLLPWPRRRPSAPEPDPEPEWPAPDTPV